MPFRDVQTFLEDILESSQTINTFIADMDYSVYQSNLKTKRAVERQLQILSEAASRLRDDAERLCPIINWRGVRGLGNVLCHEYRAVDDQRVWQTLKQKLPLLQSDVENALNSLQAHELPDHP